MPIQIIEENRRKTGSERFGEAIGGIARGAGDFMQQLNAQKQQQAGMEAENKLAESLGINLTGVTNPEIRKLLVQGAQQGKEKENAFSRQLQLEKQKHDYAKELKGMGNEETAADKKFKKELEDEQRVKDTAQSSFNTAARLLKKGNLGRGSGVIGSIFGGETAQDTGEFQTATGGLEAILVDMVSRGTLSNSRFKYITETLLPKPTDLQDVIHGKLKALAEMLHLDPKELLGDEQSQGSEGSKPSLSSFHR